MADPYPYHRSSSGQQLTTHGHGSVTSKSVVCASLAGVAVGGPLFGLLGFSFLATLTLLLICFPLILLFSPLLLCVSLLFVGALAGFAAAGAMAVAGVSMLAWSYKEMIAGGHLGLWFGGERLLIKENHPPYQHQENRLIKIQ
ncbi:hypothetical protein LWI28_005403 [Acer negundo]|uniref:Oleosin n=1 Tax=Acer negundo TaxID=4023 RepID=A0AAD5NVV8_ACENE|nr:hypothetical protein LWI28_005403 [Acer negundo]KAK4852680.1 hypothetical protein QYF36_026138 [Acer negundo]